MSGQTNIKWKQSDNEKLRKAVRSYNAKISRLHKRDDIYKAFIPEKVSYKELKSQIGTRQELNKKLKELQKPSSALINGPFGFELNKRDNETLKKEVRKFNAKIDKLAKKDPAIASSLPEKIKVKDIKSIIHSRDDLKTELQSLRKFVNNKTATKLVPAPNNANDTILITKWQRDDMLEREAKINDVRRARKQEYENLPAKDRGAELEYTVAERQQQIGMGKAEEKMYNDINAFTENQSHWDIKAKHRTLRKESQSEYWTMRDYLVRENYIKSIERNYSETEAQDILSKLRNMDIGDFMETFYQEDIEIQDNYKETEEEKQAELTALRARWLPNK